MRRERVCELVLTQFDITVRRHSYRGHLSHFTDRTRMSFASLALASVALLRRMRNPFGQY